jgi:hypothetical protein
VGKMAYTFPATKLQESASLVCNTMHGNFFIFFGRQKKHLASRRFATDADIMQAVTSWLQALDTAFLYCGTQALVPLWNKCLNVSGDYVESGVYHLLLMCHLYIKVRIKFLAGKCLKFYIFKLLMYAYMHTHTCDLHT